MVLGIDLGTTNSVVACVDNGEARVIPNDRGNRLTPSVVSAARDGTVLVGESALNHGASQPERTFFGAKRHIGSRTTYRVDGNEFTPEWVGAQVLTKLKADAATFLGQVVADCVITVPAHFSDAQRNATKKAAEAAGFRVLRLVNEPTAAAIAAARSQDSHGNAQPANLLVYDLGGGTFDVTVLRKDQTGYQVLAGRGRDSLGGLVFDEALATAVLAELGPELRQAFATDPVLKRQLMAAVERLKVELSTQTRAELVLPFIMAAGGISHVQVTMTRGEFEALIQEHIDTTIELCLTAIADAGLTPATVDAVVFSGGSSRIPLVHSALAAVVAAPRASHINPDEIVAIGAAWYADSITPQRRGAAESIVLRDVSYFSLGVEVDDGSFVALIPKNSRIPAEITKTFTTVSDHQPAVEIHVLQGEQPRAVLNQSLGRFVLTGIRSGARGRPRIAVTFVIDEDGIVRVTAKDRDTGAEHGIAVTPSHDESGDDALSRLPILLSQAGSLHARLHGRLDAGFEEEIREIVALAQQAVVRRDERLANECRLALEIVVTELADLDNTGRALYAEVR